MRNFLSDHFVLMARLIRRPTHCHTLYLRGRIEFPLRALPDKERSRADAEFQILKALEPVPPNLKRPPCPFWILPASVWLIDKRAAFFRNPRHSQNMARGITRTVCRSLMVDSRRRAEEAATEIGACLEPATGEADPCGLYTILKR